MKKVKKIVIANTIPLNGGDEALLMATLRGLELFMDKPSVTILTNNPVLCAKQESLSHLKIDWDWEYAFLNSELDTPSYFFRIGRKIRQVLNNYLNLSYYHPLSRLLSSEREKRVYRIYQESDLILLGAGGYIHDYYGYEKRLNTIEFLVNILNKDVVFFAQSIGPFWKQKNFSRLRYIFDLAKYVILREEMSLNHLKSIDYHCKNVTVTNDVAFYLNDSFSKIKDRKYDIKKIAVNFREWPHGNDPEMLFNKSCKLVSYLITKGYELTFVSTCQGILGYIDDSKYASIIYNSLSDYEKTKVKVLKKKFSLSEFNLLLKSYDAYIGMRMHGAILSLMSGIPALNIAYEDKSIGVFKGIGIGDYAFDYRNSIEIWIQSVDLFISDYMDYSRNLPYILNHASKLAEKNFKILTEFKEY